MIVLLRMLGPVTWLGIAAGLQMMGALLLFKSVPDPVFIATFVLITFGIYSLNKFTDCEDGFNCPERRKFFQNCSKLILLPISMFSISLILLTATHRLEFIHIVLIATGILYSVKLIPYRKSRSTRFTRLKDILFIKNITVSLLWGISPFVLAANRAGFSNMSAPCDLAVIILAFFGTSLINTTSCDVRDRIGDRHVGVTTVATKFGKRYTGLYLLAFGLVTSILVCVVGTAGLAGRPVCILFIGTMLWTTIVALPIYFNNLRIPENLIEPLIDSEGIVCGVGLITLTLF